MDLVAQGGQGGTVQHPSRRIAYFFHRQVHPAHGFITAVSAANVRSLARARYGREGTIKQPDDLSQIDIGGVTC